MVFDKSEAPESNPGAFFKGMIDEATILERLRAGDIAAFKIICVEYSEALEIRAFSILGNANRAREIVTDLLGKLLAKELFCTASLPLLDFLYAEVREACSNEFL